MIKTLAYFILLSICFNCSQAWGQAPIIEWQKSFGGTDIDIPYTIIQTADSGYIVGGVSYSNDGDISGNLGSADCWILKLDTLGDIEWKKNLGGTDSESISCIQQTVDGGYIIAGSSYSNDVDVTGNHGSSDYWVVKQDGLGNIQWQKSLGGTDLDQAYSIQQTADNGYIVAGYASSNDGDVSGNHGLRDYWVVKLNSLGDIQWEKTLGGTNNDIARAVKQTNDGDYIVAGYSSSNDGDLSGNQGADDFWIVKLDASGNMQWQKSLGGTDFDQAFSIQLTADNGYIVVGNTDSNDGDVSGNNGRRDIWVVMLDTLGNVLWQKTIGGSNNEDAFSIQKTSNNGYIVSGQTASNDGDVSGNQGILDYWVVELKAQGNIRWQKSLGGSSVDTGEDIQQTTDGGFIVAGFSSSIDGDISVNNGSSDFWIVKLSSMPLSTNEFIAPTFKMYPNPATKLLYVKTNTQSLNDIKIFDLTGRMVLGSKTSPISIEMLSSGIYTVQVRTNNRLTSKKIIKK